TTSSSRTTGSATSRSTPPAPSSCSITAACFHSRTSISENCLDSCTRRSGDAREGNPMRKLTRRELLEDALFAATLAATAGSSHRVWAEPSKPSGRVVGPNDKIRLAVLGVHGRGRDHLHGYTRFSDVTIAALCDPDLNVVAPALRIVTGAGRPEPKVVQDLRHIMDDPEIDAASIATPNHWHALAAIWAMQAGKDVYVEKPVSHNVHEGRVMVDTARKYKRICQAGTQIRSNPGAQAAIRYVHEGHIGKVEVS